MSLQRNILVNYTSQIYVTVISIVTVPIYVQFMGAEAYGLVGFFAILQAWFQLLDMGLTLTMAREAARYKGGAIDVLRLRRLLRAMEGIFAGVALLGCVVLLAASGTIAISWLKVQQLPLNEVQNSIMLMAVIVALRWVSGLYRGVVAGFEQFGWLSGFNSITATARFVMVIPYFICVGASPTQFFVYQLAMALIEVVVLVLKTYRMLPRIDARECVRWEWASIRSSLAFSATISFASLVWVLATQADKLVLSNLLPLADYGYFTLAALISGGVVAIANPISGPLLPRLTKLSAEGNEADLKALFRSATQLVVAVVTPVTLVLAFFPQQVLWIWTGNTVLVEKVATVLSLYAIGSGISVVAAFPYYLQYAMGNLRLHLIGSVLFVLVMVPTLFYLIAKIGMNGAGATWVIVNLVYFLIWVPVVYRSLVPGLYWPWLIRDVVSICSPSVLVIWIVSVSVSWPIERIAVGLQFGVIFIFISFTSAVGSSEARAIVATRIFRIRRC